MIRSRVSGKSRMRLPSARASALPIAAPVGPTEASPRPKVGSFGIVDQLDLDLGNVAEAQDRIVVPGGGGDPAILEAHLLAHHEARALDDAAFDLVARAVRAR